MAQPLDRKDFAVVVQPMYSGSDITPCRLVSQRMAIKSLQDIFVQVFPHPYFFLNCLHMISKYLEAETATLLF